LERSELGGSHGCPIHSAPSLGQSIDLLPRILIGKIENLLEYENTG